MASRWPSSRFVSATALLAILIYGLTLALLPCREALAGAAARQPGPTAATATRADLDRAVIEPSRPFYPSNCQDGSCCVATPVVTVGDAVAPLPEDSGCTPPPAIDIPHTLAAASAHQCIAGARFAPLPPLQFPLYLTTSRLRI